MRRYKIILIFGGCILGLLLTACGQKSTKNKGDTPGSSSQISVTSAVIATESTADYTQTPTPVYPDNTQQITDGLSTITAAVTGSDGSMGDSQISGSAEGTEGDDSTITPEITGDAAIAPETSGEATVAPGTTGGPDEVTGSGSGPEITGAGAGVTGSAEVTTAVSITKTPDSVPTNTPKPTVTSAPKPTNTPNVTPSKKVTEVSKTMYPSTRLNVRADNNSSSKLLGVFDVNESVHVTGLCDNGWARVDYNGTVAYVSYKYLSESKVGAATATPKPATVTPKPATPTPTKKPSNSVSLTDSHGAHTFDLTYHNKGQSYYSDNSDIIQDHLKCINELRASVGASPLTLDVTVSKIASYRTAEMVELGMAAYDDPLHKHPGTDVDCYTDVVYFYQNGYQRIGENISHIKGSWSYFYSRGELGETLFNKFKVSVNHYNNMVNKEYTKVGLCVYVSNSYVLITQIFE